jgi:hypothetical protein
LPAGGSAIGSQPPTLDRGSLSVMALNVTQRAMFPPGKLDPGRTKEPLPLKALA